MDVDGEAAPVVDDPQPTVREDGDGEAITVARHRFVDGVVDQLPDQLVQPTFAGGADVHPGPLTDGVQTFENRDRLGAVLALLVRHVPPVF